MPQRMSFFLAGFLAIASAVAQPSSAAADDCLLKPNALAPQGSHWYYHVERGTQRQCWYLGAEGAKVRAPARQATAPARPRAPKNAQEAVQAAVQPASGEIPASATAFVTTAPAGLGATETRVAAPDKAAAAFPIRRPDAAPVAVPVEAAASTEVGTSNPPEQAALQAEDDMPLVWPVLTAEETAAADESTGSSFVHLVAVFAAGLGGAALIGSLILRIFARRGSRRTVVAQEPDWSGSAPPVSPRSHAMFAEAAPMLEPNDQATDWSAEPEHEAAETVPDLLQQLRRQSYQHQLRELALAPAR